MQLAFESPMIPVADTKRLLEVLPYELTQAQKRVWEEIEQDLSKEFSMNRMIQGDVGSGKTIIAFLALLMTAANRQTLLTRAVGKYRRIKQKIGDSK